MSGDFDPRDVDSRERDDGIHDREDEWLTLVRGPGSAAVRDGSPEDDVRDRDTTIGERRAIVNHAIAMTIEASILGTCSCAISICRADLSASSCTIATATTR